VNAARLGIDERYQGDIDDASKPICASASSFRFGPARGEAGRRFIKSPQQLDFSARQFYSPISMLAAQNGARPNSAG